MTDPATRPILSSRGVFALAAILALGYAIGTEHVWEDYLITWKSSRHLATGEGLVFHVGERVHTFTSPLGVLLPALCSLLTLNQSDEAALWLFRLMSIAAFACGAALMHRTMTVLGWQRAALTAVILWMVLDAKSLDCTINGMETGLLLGFVAYCVWSLFACKRRQWLHLGLAWAGLMWTRPDGFIYIGAMALGVLIFKGRDEGGLSRREWLKIMFRAGLVCTVLYLPWFIGAWVYYGTPVPNTITAKAAAAGPKTVVGALWMLVKLPVVSWAGVTSVDGLLMPALHMLGGWPKAALILCRIVSATALLLWLVPVLPRAARVASFAYWILAAYLAYYPAYPASWYQPGPAWLALFALGGSLSWVCLWFSEKSRVWRLSLAGTAVLLLFGQLWLTFHYGRLARVQQTLVDGGNRRTIGLWLKEHARPDETMFMECLGYLGYYSGLKTLDFPGLSSPEVVRAAKEVGHDWDRLIQKLDPDWLVLRPWEVESIIQHSPALLGGSYEFVRSFDVIQDVSTFDLQGHAILGYDSLFLVFHRKPS